MTESGKDLPPKVYARLKQEAIEKAYANLSDAERALIDRLTKRLEDGIIGMGEVSARDFLGSVGIEMTEGKLDPKPYGKM